MTPSNNRIGGENKALNADSNKWLVGWLYFIAYKPLSVI